MPFDVSTVSVPFRMQPGLRRLVPTARHFTPIGPGDAAFAAKLVVLSSAAGSALLAAPGFDPEPALRAIAARAACEHPDVLVLGPADRVEARRLGWAVADDGLTGDGPAALGACLDGLPPTWRLAGLLSLAFAEDLAVLDGDRGTVPWLAVCLPSSWSPADKVGRSFAAVHAPVADNGLVLAAAEHLVGLVTGGERWERFVWTLTDSARLDRHPARCPAARWPASLDAPALAAASWLRSERQTFFPVPDTRQAVFTIHVETAPLGDVIVSPEHARVLHAALSTMSPAVLAYRGLTDARDRLLEWLEVRTEDGAPARRVGPA